MMTVADAELLEREQELEALRALIDGALARRGAVALVQAPSGQGKTSLLRTLRAGAEEAGLRVLSADGAELEREFPFGIVRQLFASLLRSEGAQELLCGPGEAARAVLEGAPGEELTAEALSAFAANLAEVQPLAILV